MEASLEPFKNLLTELGTFGISTGVLLVLAAGVYVIHRRLLAFYADRPSRQHYRQFVMLCICLFAAVLAIILLPLSDLTQGQLLLALAILLVATIAFASTTLVGNLIAGLTIRSLHKIRPGDYIHVGDHFGRIAVMDMLHIKLQTEDRSLTVLPNLYLVSNPVQVLRSSGVMLQVDVSLSYEVPRKQAEKVLLQAVAQTGLEKPVVKILALEDLSVRYQVAGLLTDMDRLIGMRSKLRAQVLDDLHAAGMAIALSGALPAPAPAAGAAAVPLVPGESHKAVEQPEAEVRVVDKAKQAEELRGLKKDYTAMSQELIGIEQELGQAGPGDERQPINLRKKKLEARMRRAEKEIHQLEADSSGHRA